MLERTREALQPITDRWIDQARALLDDVESLEEFRSRLVELYPQMTLDQYADALAEAMAASHLAGRNEVTEESPDALR
jgi:phage gp29-like protein